MVTTLAGATANTTRVDGVGAAAGIPALGSSTYAAMKVSPDNNWLYFLNGNYLRKMGINPSDSTNYRNVTSVMPITLSPAGGGLVFSSDGTKIFQVVYAQLTGQIKIMDLSNNTVSNLLPDGNAANKVCAAWMVQGPNNTAILRYHPNGGTAAYQGDSPAVSTIRPQRGSRPRSSTGPKVQLMPADVASSAATRSACVINAGLKLAA